MQPRPEWPIEKHPIYGCWTWTGNVDERGYPWLWIGRGRRAWAHRHVWEALRGPIPPERELDHTCRNRSCVRPEHLELVDQRENKRRMQWRHRAKASQCKNKHDLYQHGRRTPNAGMVCLLCAPL